MDINKRLKELNNLPENHQIKGQIYERIHQEKPIGLAKWKEGVLIFSIAVISLFLLLVPTISPERMTASAIEVIYSNFGGKEGKFTARSSSLYMGVEKVEDPLVSSFFENYTNIVQESEGKLGNHISDVLVVRNGHEERYQVSDTGMLHVDSGKFYNGDGKVYSEVFDELYSVDVNSLNLIPPLMILAVNLWSYVYYKRRKIEIEYPLKDQWWFFALILLMFVAIVGWALWIGPLYVPSMILLVVLYAIVMWIVIKRNVKTYSAYKVEAIKMVILTVAMIILIVTY